MFRKSEMIELVAAGIRQPIDLAPDLGSFTLWLGMDNAGVFVGTGRPQGIGVPIVTIGTPAEFVGKHAEDELRRRLAEGESMREIARDWATQWVNEHGRASIERAALVLGGVAQRAIDAFIEGLDF